MNKIDRYVAGFLFWSGSPEQKAKVLLVEKRKPPWQEGLRNGIGGRVENGETMLDAMRREFLEETGLNVQDWDPFCQEAYPESSQSGYLVQFYRAHVVGPLPEVDSVNDQSERMRWHYADECCTMPKDYVGNCTWLIPMALDWRRMQAQVVVTEAITERSVWHL